MIFTYLAEQDYRNYANLYCNSNATKGEQANKIGEKVVFNLHNKHLSWFKLFEHPKILSILDVILKEGAYNNDEPYYLNNISARCPLKGYQDNSYIWIAGFWRKLLYYG